ncbi:MULTISPECIES: hypothetical protein [Streptomyces]|nr:hypothetical protein [Streptomyces sp. G7(2002)]WDT58381.1 hypothetical protein NUT86_32455 [Streptomyces sp. G7(2002)]
MPTINRHTQVCAVVPSNVTPAGERILMRARIGRMRSLQVSIFVEFVKGVADAPTWWSQDIFTMHTEGVGALLNYALPAVIHLLAGQGIAARIRRRSPCCVNPNL